MGAARWQRVIAEPRKVLRFPRCWQISILHYAFDAWMAREFPAVPFERYADDAVVHCKSERQARFVLGEIKARMADCHLELNDDKTRIVYCKDSNRKGSHEHERFDFLGLHVSSRTST